MHSNLALEGNRIGGTFAFGTEPAPIITFPRPEGFLYHVGGD